MSEGVCFRSRNVGGNVFFELRYSYFYSILQSLAIYDFEVASIRVMSKVIFSGLPTQKQGSRKGKLTGISLTDFPMTRDRKKTQSLLFGREKKNPFPFCEANTQGRKHNHSSCPFGGSEPFFPNSKQKNPIKVGRDEASTETTGQGAVIPCRVFRHQVEGRKETCTTPKSSESFYQRFLKGSQKFRQRFQPSQKHRTSPRNQGFPARELCVT